MEVTRSLKQPIPSQPLAQGSVPTQLDGCSWFFNKSLRALAELLLLKIEQHQVQSTTALMNPKPDTLIPLYSIETKKERGLKFELLYKKTNSGLLLPGWSK